MEYTEWYEIHWRKFPEYPDGPKHPFVDSGVEKFDTDEEAWAEANALHASRQYSNIKIVRQSTLILGTWARGRPS